MLLCFWSGRLSRTDGSASAYVIHEKVQSVYLAQVGLKQQFWFEVILSLLRYK